MKPLLRAVLVINALIFLGAGVLFLLTPWASLYDALQLEPVQPAFVGQLFGIALIGLSWIAFHAAIDGALTATAAKVAGHVEWLSGLVMLVWLLGLRTPQISGFGQVVVALIGVVLLVLGLGSVRLSGAVRRRERAAAAGAVSASRAEKRAKQSEKQPETYAETRATENVPNEVYSAPVDSVSPIVTVPPFPERVAQPIGEPVTATTTHTAPAFDPLTGRVTDPGARTFDPLTGRAVDPLTGRAEAAPGTRTEPGLSPDPARRDPR